MHGYSNTRASSDGAGTIEGHGHGVHERRRTVSACRCERGDENVTAADDESGEIFGAEIGGEMAEHGVGIGIASEEGREEVRESWMSREFQARGAFARACFGSGSGIAVHSDGMRRCGVPEYVAAAGISDYHARRGVDGAHCYVPLGDARLVVVAEMVVD